MAYGDYKVEMMTTGGNIFHYRFNTKKEAERFCEDSADRLQSESDTKVVITEGLNGAKSRIIREDKPWVPMTAAKRALRHLKTGKE